MNVKISVFVREAYLIHLLYPIKYTLPTQIYFVYTESSESFLTLVMC